MMAGFRLLSKDAAGGRWLIRYRTQELLVFQEGTWRTLASYGTMQERDEALAALLGSDFWSVEID